MSTTKTGQTLRAICEGAIFIAIAWALSFVELNLWFQGGSIDAVMIPLVIFAVRWGAGWGLGASLLFGTLKFFLAGGFAIGWASILLDYTIAYMMIGLAGLFRGRPVGLIYGSIVGGIGRFLIHFLSGITIYAQYMPEEFMGITMENVWFYSALYNGGYMLPNIVLSCVAGALLMKPLARYLGGNNRKAMQKGL